MLQGRVPWPEDLARRYIEAGLWEGITVAEMIERTARRQPGKVAVIQGDRRTYVRRARPSGEAIGQRAHQRRPATAGTCGRPAAELS